MKKTVFLLLIAFAASLFAPKEAAATHMQGGEITWECLPSGEFVFYLDVYRVCNGIPINYLDTSNKRTIHIMNQPYPTNGLRMITVRPDTAKFFALNEGIREIYCRDTILNCDFREGPRGGMFQHYPYKSTPIRLTGVPPTDGWYFVHEFFCCRSNYENIANTGGSPIILRSAMYPYRDPATNQLVNVNQCYDASPKFAARPMRYVCEGIDMSYNYQVKDMDQDSLTYEWVENYNVIQFVLPFDGVNNPIPLNYRQGYSLNSILPGPALNPDNKSIELNSQTGTFDFRVGYNTIPWPPIYLSAMQVNSYRNGQKIASNVREMPFVFTNCDSLSIGSKNINPFSYVNGNYTFDTTIYAFAGDKITLPLEFIDADAVTINPTTFQNVSVEPSKGCFALDYTNPNNCEPFLNGTCATLNPPPVYDSIQKLFLLKGNRSVQTTFEWQTSYAHVPSNNLFGTYSFSFQANDDHCSYPTMRSATITVIVYPPGRGQDVSICSGSSFTFPNGTSLQNINKSFIHVSRFNVPGGQDSAVVTRLQVTPDLTLNVAHPNLESVEVGATYQWLNCDSSYAVVQGATAATFTPDKNGNYSVEIDKNGCKDTTDCVSVIWVGIDENQLQSQIKLVPNPTKGQITLSLGQRYATVQLTVRNVMGQLMQEKAIVGKSQIELDIEGDSGIYFIQLQTDNGQNAVLKVVKE